MLAKIHFRVVRRGVSLAEDPQPLRAPPPQPKLNNSTNYDLPPSPKSKDLASSLSWAVGERAGELLCALAGLQIPFFFSPVEAQ